jgi:hypothetical protein
MLPVKSPRGFSKVWIHLLPQQCILGGHTKEHQNLDPLIGALGATWVADLDNHMLIHLLEIHNLEFIRFRAF